MTKWMLNKLGGAAKGAAKKVLGGAERAAGGVGNFAWGMASQFSDSAVAATEGGGRLSLFDFMSNIGAKQAGRDLAGAMQPAMNYMNTTFNNTSSLVRLAWNKPGPVFAGIGMAGLALAAAPTAIDIKASMDASRQRDATQRSYQTEASMLNSMRSSMVHPSPGTGAVPSLRDRFANSTAGLVQGLHRSRMS